MKKYNLLKYTWPIFLEYIMQLLVTNVDKIMVNTMSETAVSSIANATTVLEVLLNTFTVISLAITIMASQYFGKNDHEKIKQVYSMGLLVTGVTSLALSIILIITSPMLFSFIKVPVECMKDTLIYMNIMLIGLVIQGLYSGYVAIFRTQGWMKYSLFVSFIINTINIVGNYLLIYGVGFIPSLGVAGAAISSVLSRVIGLILLIIIFNRNSQISIDFKSLKPWPSDLFKTMLKLGLPSGGEGISYNASQMVILMFVNMFGNAIIKLRSFASMFQMCSYMFSSSISQASQIIVGYIIGSGDNDLADKEVNKCLWISMFVSVLASAILYIFSDQIYGLFIKEAYLLAIAKKVMLVQIFLETARAVNMTMVRCLQAAGDTMYPMTIGIIFMWGVATLFSYILGVKMNMGLVGVWIAMCLDESIRAIIFIIRWKQGKWRSNQI